jgi:hypothetical protein
MIAQDFETHDQVYEFLYDTPTGDYTDAIPGMTVWIGSQPGRYDYGQARLRKPITETLIAIGEESEIALANDLYVTIVDEMGIWAKHLFISNDQTVFMDRDIEYVDQHTVFDPIPIMGCPAVVDVDAYPATVLFKQADRSWVFDSTISSWSWTATAGTMSDETTDDPTLTISSYPTGGQIRVALTLTSAAGAEYTGYRYIKVYDSSHRPITEFSVSEITGDYSEGGISFDVTLFGQVERESLRDRAPIILFTEDYYGDHRVSIGQLEGRENIVAVGWVAFETIEWNPSEGGTVKFSVYGAQHWMEKMNGFPTGVGITGKTPEKWTQVSELTVDKGLYHFLHWRTTLTATHDVTLTGDSRFISAAKSPNSSLWGQIAEIASASIFASPGFDPMGRFFVSIDPQVTPVADRASIPVIQTFDYDEWEESITINRATVPEISQLFFSGISVDKAGKGKSYFSLSPGRVFRRFGSVFMMERILLLSQDQSNELCGLLSGWKNNVYPDIQIKLASNNRMFTLFPPQYGHITIGVSDTIRGIDRDINIVPRSFSIAWDEEAGSFSTTVKFEAETFEDLNVTGDIPGVIESIEIVNPPINSVLPPPLPIVITPPTETTGERPTVVVIAGDQGVFYTENGNADDVADIEWNPMNDGLTEDEYSQINNMFLTPDGKVWVHSVHSSGSIHVAAGIGWPFKTLVTGNDIGAGFEISAIGHDPFQSCRVVFSAGLNDAYDLYETDSATYSAKGHTIHYRRPFWGMQGQCIFYAGGYWVHFGDLTGVFSTPYYVVFNSDASAGLEAGDATTAVGQDFTYRRGIPIGTQNAWFEWDGSGAGRYNKGSSNPFTQTRSDDAFPNPRGGQGMAASPTGTVIMASDTGLGTPYRSLDGGDTWESMGGTMPAGTGSVDNCADDFRFLFAGGTAIRFTPDVGETWESMEGNLSFIAPLINISFVRYVK